MDIFGYDFVYLLIGLVLSGALLASLLSIVGAVLINHFWKTGKAYFPRVMLALLNVLEAPIKSVLWIFGLSSDNIFRIRSNIYHILYKKEFAAVPYDQRAIFLPQCLRNQKCPANMDEEGLHCKNCGKCEVGKFKTEMEKLGYMFFVAPGGTMVKRMIKKYKPKAVLGVGCENEIQMGSEMAIKYGVIPQTVALLKSGCVETIVDWDEIRRVANLNPDNVND